MNPEKLVESMDLLVRIFKLFSKLTFLLFRCEAYANKIILALLTDNQYRHLNIMLLFPFITQKHPYRMILIFHRTIFLVSQSNIILSPHELDALAVVE